MADLLDILRTYKDYHQLYQVDTVIRCEHILGHVCDYDLHRYLGWMRFTLALDLYIPLSSCI